MYKLFIKRLLDVLLSGLALVILSPLFAVLAVLVRIQLGKPILYCAERPGKGEKIFRMYKFRSMTNACDEQGVPLPDEQRLTRFGRLLRASSLDELPELVNVFKGDMSLVGPRPLAVSYLPYYTEQEHHRHDVLPGITGFAQVNGRNNLSWEEKFAYDLAYVETQSFMGDVRILLKTVQKVFARDGIGQGEDAPVSFHTMRKQQQAAEQARFDPESAEESEHI